jgi:hypothetical protein
MSIIPDDKKLPLLKGMKELLSDPAHWTKDQYADRLLLSESTCFCFLGAGYKVMRDLGILSTDLVSSAVTSERDVELSKLMSGCVPLVFDDLDTHIPLVPSWNDSSNTQHEDIMNGLTCAIDKLEKSSGV